MIKINIEKFKVPAIPVIITEEKKVFDTFDEFFEMVECSDCQKLKGCFQPGNIPAKHSHWLKIYSDVPHPNSVNPRGNQLDNYYKTTKIDVLINHNKDKVILMDSNGSSVAINSIWE